MSGNREGGLKAAVTTRARHGSTFYSENGALMPKDKQRAASIKGGKSRQRSTRRGW